MTKKIMKIFRNLVNVEYVKIIILVMMFKLIDHCGITEKYRGSVHRGCNINVKLNHKIHVVFHNLKKYDSHANSQANSILK